MQGGKDKSLWVNQPPKQYLIRTILSILGFQVKNIPTKAWLS